MGVAPTKIIFMVILSFEVALVSSPNITKKGKQTSVRDNVTAKLSTRISAGVDDCPCFTTFYCYDS